MPSELYENVLQSMNLPCNGSIEIPKQIKRDNARDNVNICILMYLLVFPSQMYGVLCVISTIKFC